MKTKNPPSPGNFGAAREGFSTGTNRERRGGINRETRQIRERFDGHKKAQKAHRGNE
jgi:hypothetical protein